MKKTPTSKTKAPVTAIESVVKDTASVVETTALIRTSVRGTYALQKLRVATGNRITSNFKARLGQSPDGMSENDLEKEQQKILIKLRSSYMRITDGIVNEDKLISKSKFVGDEIISTYAELVLVDQYMALLREEQKQFRRLGGLLEGIPLYDEYLKDVDGVGSTMAGVIISEIDFSISQYASSLCKYAGIDTVLVATYKDDAGKEQYVSDEMLMKHMENVDFDAPIPDLLIDGKHTVSFERRGRTRKEWSLVNKEYLDKDGKAAIRKSITFNPFLKTKLIGILGPSFLKRGKAYVDDINMGAAKRLELAVKHGFKKPKAGGEDDEGSVNDQVIQYLRDNGFSVVIEPSKYGKIYYDYKFRLEQSPMHQSKTNLHRHNMAIRYCIKIFLQDLYVAGRTLAGLPVAAPYHEAKLKIFHGVATKAKETKRAA